ncbi:pyridoxal-phosphate dependent enzyme [Burkholderia sp. TSV86]|uniref:pyridoxal-phosphate dependent enzyme n=1 Tax=Burkholderia sp. TSV86 TaxID=1385594 RepID=UPI0012E3BD66|nr:pyridoxal-phosphate dependent enzyme [Burkholderia sp. TSV86]
MQPIRVLIVGGGLGGTMLANQLAAKLFGELIDKRVSLILLSDSPDHFYKPAFMYVAFGAALREDLVRSERSLLRPEIDFVVDGVESFDFPAQQVHTRSGQRYGYDYLVIATGCIPAPERIEGLPEAGDHFYQYDPARQLAQRLAAIERGRVFITVTFPKTHNVPHQCGIAPIETTLMLDDYLRRRGVRKQVEIVYTYPSVAQLLRNCLFLQKPTCDILPTLFAQRNIRYQRGFLGSRIRLIRSMLAEDTGLVWINQYENDENVLAHYHSTGPEILKQFEKPDFVFVGAGTTGTLGGVSRYLREHSPHTRIIAVDSVGSVTFGQPPGKRHIPGLGTSTPPAIRAQSRYDALLMIPEADTVDMCRNLARQGMLFGGSTGTVLCGVRQHAQHIPPDSCVVAISPDMGDRYVDTIFSPDWVAEHFPSLPHVASVQMQEAALS